MTERKEIARTYRGNIVTTDPYLVLKACKAIRQRRDAETEVRVAA